MTVADSTERVRPELQSHDLAAANVSVGTRLWAGATVMFFLGPFFAYLYLRSLNSFDQWRPAGIDPPQALGAVIMVLAVASSIVLLFAQRAFDSVDRRGLSLSALAIALALGVGSIAIQIAVYVQLGFGPTDGGYASVFVAWTALNALFAIGTMISLETLLAYGLRVRNEFSGAEDDSAAPGNLIRPRLAALAFYWAFLAALGVVMWVILYLA